MSSYIFVWTGEKNLYSRELASAYPTCWMLSELSFLSPLHELSLWRSRQEVTGPLLSPHHVQAHEGQGHESVSNENSAVSSVPGAPVELRPGTVWPTAPTPLQSGRWHRWLHTSHPLSQALACPWCPFPSCSLQ